MEHRCALFAPALALVLCLAAATPAAAESSSHGHISTTRDNSVVLDNRTTGSSLTRSLSNVTVEHGTRVENQNVAYAHASCTDCRTVAVAVQIIVADGRYTSATPANVALAVNESCVRCTTAAYARQYMITPAQQADIQSRTWRQLVELDREIAATTSSNLAIPDMFSRLDALVTRFEAAVQRDLDGQAGGSGAEHRDTRIQES